MIQNQLVTPVLLSGGTGQRLWPLSRKSYPKQFARIIDDTTLFQQAALRLSSLTIPNLYTDPLVITGSDYRFIVTKQLLDVGIDPGAVLIEPMPRNTAPAALVAALYLYEQDPDAILLIAPSDHAIQDAARFAQAVEAGLEAVAEGKIVTFGIQPDRAETGYGYLELETATDAINGTANLVRFVEKPDAKRAAEMLAEGRYLWNAGIFLVRAKDLIEAFKAHAADCVAPSENALKRAKNDLGFLRLDIEAFQEAPSVSIDYAVMEKADNLAVVPFTSSWSDLGDWNAVWRGQEQDENGVAHSGHVEMIDCRDSLLRSESDNQVLVGLGLDNIIAVAMQDAVLIARKDRAQDVKTVVETLKKHQARQAENLPRDYRPWGWYETLVLGKRFQVKRIVVNPGASLSLQSHHHRAEHWIVVEGTARVTVNDSVQLISENESVYIPLGARHRLENPGKLPMVLVEVQTGAYLGEDDIIRYDDIYARGQGEKG